MSGPGPGSVNVSGVGAADKPRFAHERDQHLDMGSDGIIGRLALPKGVHFDLDLQQSNHRFARSEYSWSIEVTG